MSSLRDKQSTVVGSPIDSGACSLIVVTTAGPRDKGRTVRQATIAHRALKTTSVTTTRDLSLCLLFITIISFHN